MRMVEEKVIPAMTPLVVHNYLRSIGQSWSGSGVAMELGCWLGASSVALLEGLVQAGYDRDFYAFDLWIANNQQVEKAKAFGTNLTKNQNLTYLYRNNVNEVYDRVIITQGRIPQTLSSFPGEPIEICIFDAPKTNPTFLTSIQLLEKHFVPGRTILGLLDYYSYRKNEGMKREKLKAPCRYIADNQSKYKMIASWPQECSCVFFEYN